MDVGFGGLESQRFGANPSLLHLVKGLFRLEAPHLRRVSGRGGRPAAKAIDTSVGLARSLARDFGFGAVGFG